MYALVTGASSGIGAEVARLLANRGYNLIIVARREQRLNALKEEIESTFGVKVEIRVHDLSIEEECFALLNSCDKYEIQILINNAGFGKIGYYTDIECKDEIDMIKTNIIAIQILTKEFIKRYKKGRILNVASAAAFQPGPVMSVYAATKAYVLSFSRSLNYELKRQNKKFHITTLCPGPVNTEFNEVANAHFNISAISAKRCAKKAVKGLFKRKDVVIPSLPVKLLTIGSKLAPTSMVLPVEYHVQSQKKH